MRKELGLIAAGAIAFGLQAVVVPTQAQAQAAVDMFIKIGDIKDERSDLYVFNKIDKSADAKTAANTCIASKGTPVVSGDQRYCRLDKAASTATPTNQRR
jgi:hypothetical protein